LLILYAFQFLCPIMLNRVVTAKLKHAITWLQYNSHTRTSIPDRLLQLDHQWPVHSTPTTCRKCCFRLLDKNCKNRLTSCSQHISLTCCWCERALNWSVDAVCCHCGDRRNTFFVFFSEPWCGLLSACPVHEGDTVTVGCYARYEWLGSLLQYNPRVQIASIIEFLQEDATRVKIFPELLSPPGPPPPILMMTSHTVHNVSAGEQLNYTCQIEYIFTGRGYSDRNEYANNTLTWNRCSITETVACKYLFSHWVWCLCYSYTTV